MRRGQDPSDRNSNADGITKAELLEVSGLSAKSFDTLRKAARVRGPSHGGLGWVFSYSDISALITRAESGQFTIMGAPAAEAWRGMLSERGVATPPKKG